MQTFFGAPYWLLFVVVVLALAWMIYKAARHREDSLQDPLTGALNRRAGMNILSREDRKRRGWRSSRLWQRFYKFSVITADIDHFKRVNDTYGHDAGDEVLKAVVTILKKQCRRGTDMLIIRMGGEEFLVILPGTSLEGAAVVAERLRATLETVIEFRGAQIPITASFGVATSTPGVNANDVITLADAALYRAKKAVAIAWRSDKVEDRRH